MDTKRRAPAPKRTRIRSLLNECGVADVRFEQVCAEAGVALNSLYRWERGELLPTSRHLFPLLHALRALTGSSEITVEDLYEFEDVA